MRRMPVTVIGMTLLMLISVFGAGLTLHEEKTEKAELEAIEEPAMVSSPGHVVFAQYITSDNCGFCYQYGSPAHYSIKNQHPSDYVYISYQSVSYGDTDTARAGNVNVYNWPWSASGAPDAYFGDRIDQRRSGCGGNTCYDANFNNGGGMHSTVSDYQMAAQTVANGNNIDIDIAYRYIGTGSPASNLYLYSALTESTCQYTYADGSKGHNCWKAWLTSGGTYVNQNNGGGGTAFASVSPTTSWQTESWSVPASLVSGGGASNALAIGALMSGAPSTGASNEHVYHATDSSMGALIDLGVIDFTAVNRNGADSWATGDIIDLSATIRNLGVEDYDDGGMIKLVHVSGATETEIDSAIINTLTTSGTGSTQIVTASFDTSSLSETAWDASLRVRITGTNGDGKSANDVMNQNILHDMPPVCGNPTVIGNPAIDRGESLTIEVRGDPADGVDTMLTMTPKLQFSPAGADDWRSDGVTGGVTLMGQGTSNERYEFQLEPGAGLSSGDFDIRVQFEDAGGQFSDWVVKEDAFSLNNAPPVITPDPYPSVKVEVETPVPMVGHISDMETPLSDLVVTSNSPNFVSWDGMSGKMTVLFNNIQEDVDGNPMPSAIYITVSDGVDTTTGNLMFNVIENGQPRWAGVPAIHLDEGTGDSILLNNYLSDTDADGNPSSSEDLLVAVINNTNPELIEASVNGQSLNIDTIDEDAFGEARLTLRASDGVQYSDTVVVVNVHNVNDAPTLDLSGLEGLMLKKGEEKIVSLNELMNDVDDENNEILVSVTASPQHAARHNMLSNTLTLGWDTVGEKTVMVTVLDRHDDANTYTLTVTVYDALPLHVSSSDSGADLLVQIEDALVGKNAKITMTAMNSDLGLNHIVSEWQICSITDGVCYEFTNVEHTPGESIWNFGLPFDRSSDGLLYNDQLKLASVVAIDADGNDRKFHGPLYWNITEYPADPTKMGEGELKTHILELENRIAALEAALADLDEGSEEHQEKQSEIDSIQSDLNAACAVKGADCKMDEVQSQSEDSSSGGMSTPMMVGIGMGVVILLLLTLLFVGGGRKGDGDGIVLMNQAMEVPGMDAVANSMYGGAQDIFQSQIPQATQPVAAVPQQTPPIPAAGLPQGWTMEQWQHYGAQYLEQNGL